MVLEDIFNDELLNSELLKKIVSYNFPFMFKRMSTDSWYFCLMLDNGIEIGVSSLNDIVIDYFGNVWLDVELLHDGFDWLGKKYKGVPSSRTKANINLNKIVAIYEIADT